MLSSRAKGRVCLTMSLGRYQDGQSRAEFIFCILLMQVLNQCGMVQFALSISARMCIYMYVHANIYVYVYIHVYMRIHVH